MNEEIQNLMKQAGTDISGKWMSVDNAEKFALLIIQAYNKEIKESQQETNSKLGVNHIRLRNV
jgi:hypothetical protein